MAHSDAGGAARRTGHEPATQQTPSDQSGRTQKQGQKQQGEGEPAKDVQQQTTGWAGDQEEETCQEDPTPREGTVHRWKRGSFSNHRSSAAISSMPAQLRMRPRASQTTRAATLTTKGIKAKDTATVITRAPTTVQTASTPARSGRI